MSDSADRPLRVIVADDHPIFLIGLRVVLEQDNLASVVAEACNPDELLQVLERHACDVLVTDFMMPVERQNDGLRLLQRIRRDFPALPVIVVTTLSNAGLFQSMLDLNVRGLLSKASLAGELPLPSAASGAVGFLSLSPYAGYSERPGSTGLIRRCRQNACRRGNWKCYACCRLATRSARSRRNSIAANRPSALRKSPPCASSDWPMTLPCSFICRKAACPEASRLAKRLADGCYHAPPSSA